MASPALKLEESLVVTEKRPTPEGPKKSVIEWQNEFWGGLAAMLVALPSSIAFGILVYSSIGPSYSGQGAMAGLIGACVLGLITPFIGQTRGLISAPCAPSAAVLSALVVSLTAKSAAMGDSITPEFVFVLIGLVSLFSALAQIIFGSIGGGTLIKFIPFQVVSGYLSGVGVLICLSQLPKLLGLPKGVPLWNGLTTLEYWRWPGLFVGLITMVIMISAPRISKKIPAPIFGLSGGILAYFVLAIFDKTLLNIDSNSLIIGSLQVKGSFLDSISHQLSLLANVDMNTIEQALVPAFTLAALLSIDTLKTCVAIDSMTRNRHNSNREIVGQGVGNLICALLGGLPGAGTMGASLVNFTSGGRLPLAGLFEGVFVLLAIFFLGPLLAWIPVASLAGILIVIAFRMFDWSMFRLLFLPSGRFDFLVIISVVIVAVSLDLIAASGVGIAMAIILFIRDQIHESVILQKTSLKHMSSKTQRQEQEREILQKNGHQAVICKLQGNLFFGTTDQFSRTLDQDLKSALYLLLDMRRVHSFDYTAFHLLEQIHAQLAERGGRLLFSGMPSHLYEKIDFERYLSHMGLINQNDGVMIFQTFDSALEWMEDLILIQNGVASAASVQALEIKDFHLFRGFTPKELKHIGDCMTLHKVEKGHKIVQHGDLGDELFLVRKGSFKALLPLAGGKHHHIATFEQGSFFGELAFLDRDRRTADVEAKTSAEVYVFSRSKLNEQSITFPEVGAQVFARLALAIAQRLRSADIELRALEDR